MDNLSSTKCDFCSRSDPNKQIAAPLEVLMKAIAAALYKHFGDPTHAGVPRDDGEWVGEESFVSTKDALMDLELMDLRTEME
jgi:hypothetical protein